MFSELAELHGDKGVWRLVESGGFDVRRVPIDDVIPLDVDTWADYRRLLAVGGSMTEPLPVLFGDVDDVIRRFDAHDYLLDSGTASAIYLAVVLGRPLLLEGEPGVGKTTAAKTLAAVLDTRLIRLQCYEGLTASEALYDWNYQRQLLSIRLAEARGEGIAESDLYTETYLVDRPILQCVRDRGPNTPVLLIDEIDRADDEFEALLLEFLGEAAVTVPELGTFVATRPPVSGADVQPQPRPARRAASALPVPLDRLPGAGAVGGDRPPHRARRDVRTDRAGRPVRRQRTRFWIWTSRQVSPRPSTGWQRWSHSVSPTCRTDPTSRQPRRTRQDARRP